MKKIVQIFLLFGIIFSLCGCTKKSQEIVIKSTITKTETSVASVHFPITGIQQLDQKIKNTIFYIQKQFSYHSKPQLSLKGPSELNVDYEFWKVNQRYYNIVLTSFITSPSLSHPINEVHTFVYDKEKNKFLTIEEIATISFGSLKQALIQQEKNCIIFSSLENTLQEKNREHLKFTFSDHAITFYFNPSSIAPSSCGIITYKMPCTNFKISIQKEERIKNTFQFQSSKKELSKDAPTIALTFDDGPSQYTLKIAELLYQYDANATFFVLGNKVKHYQESLKKVLEYNNEIGNHSYNHKSLVKLSLEDMKKQIIDTNTIVKETLNYDIRLLRPTYGYLNNTIKKNSGMEIVLWNVDTEDWKLRNGEKIAQKALHDIKDGKIILMHDIYKSTLEALKIILPELKKRGYQIVTVSELKEIEALRNGTTG